MDNIDEWHLARWSRLTASENFKLLPSGKDALISPGGYTYIKQKALEMVTNMWERPEIEEHKALLHGKMYEYPAYERYVDATRNYSMVLQGTENPLFLLYEPLHKDSGGSPDIINITSSATIDAGGEIKCPKNPMYHFERLKWKNQFDIKENYMQCYCQIQNLLLITGASIWQFISFDERMKDRAKQIKIIDVFPDKKFQDNLHFRLTKAVEEKYRILEEHMNA